MADIANIQELSSRGKRRKIARSSSLMICSVERQRSLALERRAEALEAATRRAYRMALTPPPRTRERE